MLVLTCDGLYPVCMDANQYDRAVSALREAVALAGGQSAFERLTGAKQQKVSYWLKHGKPIAGEYVLSAERHTGVSKHLLRPDLYPVELELDSGPPFVACDQPAISHRSANHA